jgi:hypothetical protein
MNVDLPALAITTSAMILLLAGRGPGSHLSLLVGCLCLGVAAAVRGPMLLAGIPVIAARVFLVERAPPRVIAGAVLLFVAPLAVEFALQRYLGVVNQRRDVDVLLLRGPRPRVDASLQHRVPRRQAGELAGAPRLPAVPGVVGGADTPSSTRFAGGSRATRHPCSAPGRSC